MRRFIAFVALMLSVTALAACSNSASVPPTSPTIQSNQRHLSDTYPPTV